MLLSKNYILGCQLTYPPQMTATFKSKTAQMCCAGFTNRTSRRVKNQTIVQKYKLRSAQIGVMDETN